MFDIDYRPNLWGLAGHGAGEERYIKSGEVTRSLSGILPQCDLIVGTEEEMMIAGGADEPLAALEAVRAATKATLVLKRGPMGCVVFPEAIPDSLEKGIKGPGFPVEVYNVLGAGDAFMSGFLRGFLRDEPLETCCAYANANGAFAVSRLLCSAEYPTWAELGNCPRLARPPGAAPRQERSIIHWATTRRSEPPTIMALAIDHRAQLEKIADAAGAPRASASTTSNCSRSRPPPRSRRADPVIACSSTASGGEALFRAVDLASGWPAGRGARLAPARFRSGGSLGAKLVEWPVAHTIKCLCFYHPDDPPELKTRQERELLRLHDAARTLERELLIEIIASKNGPIDDQTIARVIERLYAIGIEPDWWKLEGQASRTAWDNISRAIATGDPLCPQRDAGLRGAGRGSGARRSWRAVAAVKHTVEHDLHQLGGRSGSLGVSTIAKRSRMAGAFMRLGDLWRASRTRLDDARGGARNAARR